MILYIKVGSITNAQRSQHILRSHGYKSKIKKIEKPAESEGCGYVITVEANNNDPVDALISGGIDVRGVDKK